MGSGEFTVRAAVEDDRRAIAVLLAEVAEERDGIAAEPPLDVDAVAASRRIDGTMVAVAQGALIGEINVDPSWMGFGEIGMMVGAVAWARRRNGARRRGHRMGAGSRPAQTSAQRVSP